MWCSVNAMKKGSCCIHATLSSAGAGAGAGDMGALTAADFAAPGRANRRSGATKQNVLQSVPHALIMCIDVNLIVCLVVL